MNKKILVIANEGFTIYNFRRGLIKKLCEENEVFIICKNDVYVEKLISIGCKYFDIGSFNYNKINPVNDLMLIRKYFKSIKSISPDVVLNFTIKPNIYSSIACRFTKSKNINNITGLGRTFQGKGLINKIVILLYKIANKHSDFILFQNTDDFELFKANGILFNEYRIIPGSGIDLKEYNYSTKEKLGRKNFLFVGRIIPEKGLESIKYASEYFYEKGLDASFTVIGSSKNLEYISNVSSWKHIEFLGFRSDVKELIMKSYCVTLPSYYREGVPRTLIESGAIGRPIITTDGVGCKDIVIDGYNGFMCKQKDHKTFLNACLNMYNLSDEEYLDMCRNSRKNVEENYDEKIVIDTYLSLIEGV